MKSFEKDTLVKVEGAGFESDRKTIWRVREWQPGLWRLQAAAGMYRGGGFYDENVVECVEGEDYEISEKGEIINLLIEE